MLAVAAAVALALFGGCAHTWSPGTIAAVPMESVGTFQKGLSVHLVNDQPLVVPQQFFTDLGHTHHANYNEWTGALISSWEAELRKRGAVAGPEGRNTVNVKVDGFEARHYFIHRVKIKIHLAAPERGWQKEVAASDTSGLGLGGALENAVFKGVEKMIKDPEIVDVMSR